jgi:hypothetical protein
LQAAPKTQTAFAGERRYLPPPVVPSFKNQLHERSRNASLKVSSTFGSSEGQVTSAVVPNSTTPSNVGMQTIVCTQATESVFQTDGQKDVTISLKTQELPITMLLRNPVRTKGKRCTMCEVPVFELAAKSLTKRQPSLCQLQRKTSNGF